MSFKKYLALAVALFIPLQAFAAPGSIQYANPQSPYINVVGNNQFDLATPFSTAFPGNPLAQLSFQTIPVASVNSGAGQLLLSGQTGRTIFVNGITALVSGSASGATAVTFLCQPSGRTIATFPIAQLVTSVPVSLYSSAGASTIAGAAAGTGCAASDSVYISHTGSNLATTTQVYPTLLYTVQ